MRIKARIKKIEAGLPKDLWKSELHALLQAGTLTWEQVEPELGPLAPDMLRYMAQSASGPKMRIER